MFKQARDCIALDARVVVAATEHLRTARDGHDDEVRFEGLQPTNHAVSPRRALRVLALEHLRQHREIEEPARQLHKRNEPPVILSGERFQRREPLCCVRVADERDGPRTLSVAVDAVRRCRTSVADLAAVVEKRLEIVASTRECGPNTSRQPAWPG